MKDYIQRRLQSVERAKQAETLKEKGWESTGDVQYSLARELKRPTATGTIDRVMRAFLGELVADEKDYITAHFVKVSEKAKYISPELRQRIKGRVEAHFPEPNPRSGPRKTTEEPS